MRLRPSALLALLALAGPGLAHAAPGDAPLAAAKKGDGPAAPGAAPPEGPPARVVGPREVAEPVLGTRLALPAGWSAGWEEREDGTRVYALRKAVEGEQRGGRGSSPVGGGEALVELETQPELGMGLETPVEQEAQAVLDAWRDTQQGLAHRASAMFELLGNEDARLLQVRGRHPAARAHLSARIHHGADRASTGDVTLLAAAVRTPHGLHRVRARWPVGLAQQVRPEVDALLEGLSFGPLAPDAELLRRLTGCWEREVPGGAPGGPPLRSSMHFAAGGTYRFRPPGVGADEPGEEQGRFRTWGANAVLLRASGGLTEPRETPVAFPSRDALLLARERYERCR
jgi:hypothetical protein